MRWGKGLNWLVRLSLTCVCVHWGGGGHEEGGRCRWIDGWIIGSGVYMLVGQMMSD